VFLICRPDRSLPAAVPKRPDGDLDQMQVAALNVHDATTDYLVVFPVSPDLQRLLCRRHKIKPK
jgi:hypothetical protein